nr:MAG TPA: hypothetical protein [Caudoviricetes sp.]
MNFVQTNITILYKQKSRAFLFFYIISYLFIQNKKPLIRGL